MNEKVSQALVEKYVAFKMAFRDLTFKAAKAAMKEDVYITYAMDAHISEMPPVLKTELEEHLRRRFGLKVHKPLFFKPTIRQWLKDLFAVYSAEDILLAISQSSGIRKDILEASTINDSTLNRPFLIDLVEDIEAATGRVLLRDGDLVHLGDGYDYIELARFFATAE